MAKSKDTSKGMINDESNSCGSTVSWASSVKLVSCDDSDYDDDILSGESTIDTTSVAETVVREKRNKVVKTGTALSSAINKHRLSIVSTFEQKKPAFGLVSFFTLKVLFVDIVVAVGDVVSDFAQGYALLTSNSGNFGGSDTWIYGIVTLTINWLPGVVAAVHVFSMYRTTLPARKTIMYAVLLLLLYPIVPLMAYIFLLWRRPTCAPKRASRIHRRASQWIKHAKNGSFRRLRKARHQDKYSLHLRASHPQERHYFRDANAEEAEYFAMLAHAIAGGIESPIQFSLQVWLIMNGKIPKPWYITDQLTITDWHGNTIYLPTTGAISMLFSLLSMTKAVIEFNIIRVHIQGITSSERCWDFMILVTDHLPFLAVAAFFRISCIVYFVTYLNSYGFIPIGLFWLCNLFIGYRCFKLDTVPLWLISFISIFIPVCFTSHEVNFKNRRAMIRLQYRTFKLQCFCSMVIFLPTLVTIGIIINTMPEWNYDSNVILLNLDFNIGIAVISTMGILSSLLSIKPNWIELMKSFSKLITQLDDIKSVEKLEQEQVHSSDEEDHFSSKPASRRVSTTNMPSTSSIHAIYDPNNYDFTDGAIAPDREEESVSENVNQVKSHQEQVDDTDGISNDAYENRHQSSGELSDDVSHSKNISTEKEDLPTANQDIDILSISANNPVNPDEPWIKVAKVLPRNALLDTNFERNDSSDLSELKKKKLSRVLVGLVFLLLLFTPVIIPSIFFEATRPSPPFVYFKPYKHANETRIVQAVSLNDIYVDMTGCMQFYIHGKHVKSFVKDCPDNNRILVIPRSNWSSCYSVSDGDYRFDSSLPAPCYNNMSAIVIVDDNWACRAAQKIPHKGENCFRPSFPLTDIKPPQPLSIPMLLVQQIDAEKMLPGLKNCEHKRCLLSLAKSNDSIPHTEFECDPCLSLKDGIMFGVDGSITGNSYRSVTCLWGNQKCFGFHNEIHERRGYCDEAHVSTKFCSEPNGPTWTPRYMKPHSYEWEDDDRNLHFLRDFFGLCHQYEKSSCINDKNIKDCDRHTLSHHWSWCTKPDEVGTRFRYCYVDDSCLLEEVITTERMALC